MICICWIIPISLGWSPLGHGIWSFLYAVEFSLPLFYWGFLHLCSSKRLACSAMLVAHAYNPRYSSGRDQGDCGLKPAWANSLWDPISKVSNTCKRTGGVGPKFKTWCWKRKRLPHNSLFFCVSLSSFDMNIILGL
jgi:hypothetical protein